MEYIHCFFFSGGERLLALTMACPAVAERQTACDMGWEAPTDD